jgi:hypothetical protein
MKKMKNSILILVAITLLSACSTSTPETTPADSAISDTTLVDSASIEDHVDSVVAE